MLYKKIAGLLTSDQSGKWCSDSLQAYSILPVTDNKTHLTFMLQSGYQYF